MGVGSGPIEKILAELASTNSPLKLAENRAAALKSTIQPEERPAIDLAEAHFNTAVSRAAAGTESFYFLDKSKTPAVDALAKVKIGGKSIFTDSKGVPLEATGAIREKASTHITSACELAQTRRRAIDAPTARFGRR